MDPPETRYAKSGDVRIAYQVTGTGPLDLVFVPGFTARYRVDTLVWFEAHNSIQAAIRREKQIKEWKREWKFNLIERDNPHWIDLYLDLAP